MGAMIIPQARADEGFALLKDIVEIVKNPKAIDEAYEARRKAAELSEDEIAQAEEARSLIAQADSVRASLKEREDAIAVAHEQLMEKMSEFDSKAEKENVRLSQWDADLKSVESQQAAMAQSLKDAKDAPDKRVSEIEVGQKGWEERYNQRLEIIANKEQAQKEEDSRLADVAKKLRDKAAKLANIAQSDE